MRECLHHVSLPGQLKAEPRGHRPIRRAVGGGFDAQVSEDAGAVPEVEFSAGAQFDPRTVGRASRAAAGDGQQGVVAEALKNGSRQGNPGLPAERRGRVGVIQIHAEARGAVAQGRRLDSSAEGVRRAALLGRRPCNLGEGRQHVRFVQFEGAPEF